MEVLTPFITSLYKPTAFTSLRHLKKELNITNKKISKSKLLALLKRHVEVQEFPDGVIILKPYEVTQCNGVMKCKELTHCKSPTQCNGVMFNGLPTQCKEAKPFKRNLSYLTQSCLLSYFNVLSCSENSDTKTFHKEFSYKQLLCEIGLRTPLFYQLNSYEDIQNLLPELKSKPSFVFKIFFNTEKSLSYSTLYNALQYLNKTAPIQLSPAYLITLINKEGAHLNSDVLSISTITDIHKIIQKIEDETPVTTRMFDSIKYNSKINTALNSILSNKSSDAYKELQSLDVIKIVVRKRLKCSFNKEELQLYILYHEFNNYKTELISIYSNKLFERFQKDLLSFHLKIANTDYEKNFYTNITEISPSEKSIYNNIFSHLYYNSKKEDR